MLLNSLASVTCGRCPVATSRIELWCLSMLRCHFQRCHAVPTESLRAFGVFADGERFWLFPGSGCFRFFFSRRARFRFKGERIPYFTKAGNGTPMKGMVFPRFPRESNAQTGPGAQLAAGFWASTSSMKVSEFDQLVVAYLVEPRIDTPIRTSGCPLQKVTHCRQKGTHIPPVSQGLVNPGFPLPSQVPAFSHLTWNLTGKWSLSLPAYM